MVEIAMNSVPGLNPALGPVEIVERKGIGHPDTFIDIKMTEVVC